jgi:hypothetical protein
MPAGRRAFAATALFFGFIASAGAVEPAASTGALAAEARAAIGKFAEKLKGELMGAMKVDGPVKAIDVCNVSAPAIATDASANGWTVGRTSLKVRNPKNAPDAWEEAALKEFEAAKAKGADPKTLEKSEVVETNGVRTFRFMKAIPAAAEPCLACHGEAIKEPVKAKLAELYPADKATGYKEGDIRGAFTLAKTLK